MLVSLVEKVFSFLTNCKGFNNVPILNLYGYFVFSCAGMHMQYGKRNKSIPIKKTTSR